MTETLSICTYCGKDMYDYSKNKSKKFCRQECKNKSNYKKQCKRKIQKGKK